jgi:high-affinity nickel permease
MSNCRSLDHPFSLCVRRHTFRCFTPRASLPICSILSLVIPLLGDWKLDAALGSCLLLGLRHGFDYDHLAAISDITAVQRNWLSGLRLGMTYALGHAFMVAVLGVSVLEMHLGLPQGVDHWTERLIGLTLIVLGLGVVAGILRKDAHGHRHSRVESRLAIAINGVLWLAWKVRRSWNRNAPQPQRFQWIYSGKSVFMIGMLHGVGAETPSQLALFLLAANLGGSSRGLMGLAAFATGLVTMNALMTASMGGAFRASGHHHSRLYSVIAWAGAAYSCIIGIIFLLGISDHLPALG